MRAVYLKDISFSEPSLVVTEDKAFHLIKVVRIKIGEQILVLNGLGQRATCKVVDCDKKTVSLIVEQVNDAKRKAHIDLLLAPPKKDASSDIVKYACEIGVGKIIPLKSAYSQNGLESGDRLERLIESGLIQSNNPFALSVEKEVTFENLEHLFSQYDHVFYFSSVSDKNEGKAILESDKILLIIGPEGGFSPEEESLLITSKNIKTKQFPTWILRSQTAVCVSAGYVFGLMQKN
ncbi:RsmE family RNA methyltransferase [Bacteriovorax sp. BSW11_IV]|uniref:RsmE family RNA methyltransferase n=1 Tax=Bacteriovorax sp. BSW11_IV TaxID=1353529 RepID=UPI00040BCFBD|nr:RsmE family RNA methyltransferase [Bacteriovorax sp. BSW11_IV]